MGKSEIVSAVDESRHSEMRVGLKSEMVELEAMRRMEQREQNKKEKVLKQGRQSRCLRIGRAFLACTCW